MTSLGNLARCTMPGLAAAMSVLASCFPARATSFGNLLEILFLGGIAVRSWPDLLPFLLMIRNNDCHIFPNADRCRLIPSRDLLDVQPCKMRQKEVMGSSSDRQIISTRGSVGRSAPVGQRLASERTTRSTP